MPATEIVASPSMTAPLFSTRSSTSQIEGWRGSASVSWGAAASPALILISTFPASMGMGGSRSNVRALIERVSQPCQPVKTSDLAATVDHANLPVKTLLELPIDRRFPAVHRRAQGAIAGGRHKIEEYTGHVDTQMHAGS